MLCQVARRSFANGLSFTFHSRATHYTPVLLAFAAQRHSSKASIMTIEESMRDKLSSTFSPSVLYIRNE
jgi:hypothetical protein